MSEGWIKLHRRLLDWEWFDDHNTFRLFIYILLEANHKPKKWHGIAIKRGQLLTSSNSLSEATGLSRQSIRTSLKRLKSTNELTIKSTKRYTILTIDKYKEYQRNDEELTKQSTNKPTNSQPTANQQPTTTKELKNDKNDKKKELYIDRFEEFWKLYGKIGSKQDALKAFNKQIKDNNYEEVTRGLTKYQEWARANTWCNPKHASTWLNKRGWEDDYTIHPTGDNRRQARPRTAHDNFTAGIALALAELDE